MKKLTTGILCAVAAGWCSLPAIAQDTRQYELAASDGELNKVYTSIIRRLSVGDASALRTAQRLWIQFRDADCKLAVADVRDCLMERTNQRTEQLRSTYYTDKTGEVFSFEDRVG